MACIYDKADLDAHLQGADFLQVFVSPVQAGGKDGSGNIQAVLTDTTGAVRTDPTGTTAQWCGFAGSCNSRATAACLSHSHSTAVVPLFWSQAARCVAL